jgi:hypothetical protein
MANAPNGDLNGRATQGKGGIHADKAKLTATSTMDRANDVRSNAAHKAMDLCRYAAGIVDSATAKIGNGIESMGGTLRDKGPHKGTMGAATSRVANALERGGRYLQEERLSGITDDLTELVRRKLIVAETGIGGDVHLIIKQQLALFRAELKQDLHKTKETLVSLVCGVVLLLLGSALLCLTVVHLLEWAFRPQLELWVCYLIVGSVAVVIGGVLRYYGRTRFRSLIAEESVQYIEEKLELKTKPN